MFPYDKQALVERGEIVPLSVVVGCELGNPCPTPRSSGVENSSSVCQDARGGWWASDEAAEDPDAQEVIVNYETGEVTPLERGDEDESLDDSESDEEPNFN
jgi:hypothetical protein